MWMKRGAYRFCNSFVNRENCCGGVVPRAVVNGVR